MTRIQIKAVTEAPSRSDPNSIKKNVETIDGIKYSAFKSGKKGLTPGYDLIVPGAILDVDIYDSGKYKNIDAARAVTDATPSEKQQVAKAVEAHKDNSLSDREKNAYIVRESCLSSAVAFATAFAIPPAIPEHVLSIAQKFETWVLTGKTPNPPTAPLDAPQQAAPIKAEPKSEEAGLFWPHLENVGQMLTRANQHNIKMTEVWADLGIKSSKDITDPDAAWAAIAQKRGLTP